MRARSAYSSCSGSGVSSQPMYTDATEGSRAKCATAAAASSMWMRLAQCGARRARRPGARSRSISCSRPAIQAGQSQRRGGFGSGCQQCLGFQQDAAVEALRRGRCVLVDPAAPVFAIDGAGRHEHDPLQMGGVQRGEHIAQPVDEHAAIDGFVARAGAGRRIRRVMPAGRTGMPSGREMSPRSQAMPSASSAGGWRRRAWISRPGPAAAARRAGQVAATDEQRALGHAHMPL